MRLLLLVTLGLGACFNIDEPPCGYACGPNGACPDDYSCGSDNYCHLHGTGICSFSDASLLPDLAMNDLTSQDLSTAGPDLSTAGGPDLSTADDLSVTPSPSASPSPTPTPSPSPTPTPSPSPSPTPAPMIVSFGVVDQEAPGPQQIPIVKTTDPTPSPSPAPQNEPVTITEQISPAGAASSVTLIYTYQGIGPLTVPMTLSSSSGGSDFYTGNIDGWPASLGLILYTVQIDDFYSGSFTDPMGGGSYTYQEQ